MEMNVNVFNKYTDNDMEISNFDTIYHRPC